MKLVAPASPSGATSIRHFNFAQADGTVHRYSIGSEPVEVPDADARTILGFPGKITAFVEPVEEKAEEKPADEKPAKTRRGKEAATE